MISSLLRTLRGLRPTFLLAFVLLPGVVARAQSVTVSTPTLPGRGATSYVIGSDRTPDNPDYSSALYNRWYIPAEVAISVNGGFSGQSGYWRARFRLVTTGGTPVNLESDDPSNWVVTGFQFANVPALGTSPLTFAYNLVPDTGVRLDPNTSYQPQIEIQKWNSVAGMWETTHGPLNAATSYTFIHFTAPYATDSAVNVVARLNNVSWNRRFAVNTAVGNEDFRVTANINLYRYDEPHAGLTGISDNVPYRFTFALYDTANLVTPVATATTTASFSTSMARNVNSGGITAPSNTFAIPTFNFRPVPGVQLDSANRTYRVVVTISHQEVVVPSTYVSSTTRTTPDVQLLHFNGRVLFGAGGTQIVTTANQISGDPSAGAVDMGTFFNTTLTVPADMGSIDASPTYTYGGAIPVSLLANGDAVCTAGSFAVTAPAFPDVSTYNKIRFSRFGTTLNNGGLFANLALYLPSGLGWASTATKKQLAGSVGLSNVQLLGTLRPSSDQTFIPPGAMWITEETKPLAYQVERLVWSIGTGQLEFPVFAPDRVVYHRAAELNSLDVAPVDPALKIKFSNEQYFRAADVIDSPTVLVKGGPVNDARLNVKLKFAPGSFYTHFPYAAAISWSTDGYMEIDGDRVVPGASLLTGVNPVLMGYGRNCSGESCAITPNAAVQLIPDSGRLIFTENGGLSASGVLSSAVELRWGYVATLANFAHRAGTFADANFHMAGHFLRGDLNTTDTKRGPGVILFSGTDLTSGLLTERPLTTPYANGFADYAGMNFRCGPADAAASPYDGKSVLAGSSYGPYDLKNRSKYYARLGGVSGIHDKVIGTPETLSFYGYEVRLDNFGLAFLSSVNTDSRTEGELFVKDPSDIAQPFEKLMFACNGALLSADVPGGTNAQTLAYWNAPIDISAIEFVRNESDACNPGVGYLTLGVAGYASHVRETLFGTLGFLSNGNLIPKSFGLANVDSRLKMPAQTTLRGPKKQTTGGGYEEYTVTPVVDAYFNQLGSGPSFTPPAPASRVPEDGFITFAGYFKVPFFEALEVHVQTGSNRPPEDPDEAATPWSLSTLHVANGAWSGSSYFSGSYFDESNRALPPAVTPDNYRTTSTYYVHAKQEWLGGSIEFDYPLVWNSSTRSFKSPETVENDFVVIQIEHEVKYLSADRLEITFGAQYDGLPQINLTNFVFNAIDDATGMAQATIEALTQSLVDQLNDGIDRMAEILNDQMDAFFERILGATLDPFVDAVYADLASLWTGGTWNTATVNGVIALRFDPNGVLGSLKGDVFARLRDVSGGAVDTIDIILESIQKIQDALDAVAEIAIPSNPEIKDYTKDLAAKLVEKLATQINGNLASVLGGVGAYDKIANLLDPILTDLEPTLNQIRDVLVEMKAAFDEIKAQIDPAIGGAQQFLTEMRDIFQTANNLASGEFGSISAEISVELDASAGFFAGFGVGSGKKNFLAYSPDEIKQRIRQEISDRLMASTYVTRVQETIKQQIQDLANSVTTASDTVFAQINEAVKGVIGGALSEIDNEINGLLGDISQYMGAGKISGYAYFQGSGLRKVRLDGEFTWEIPKETTLKAYLEINQYTSEGEGPACTNPLPADMTFTEVIIGAKDVGCGFIGLDIKVDVEVKLSFEGSNAPWSLRPIGVAGSFAMTEGEISFEAFTITDLAAGVAFGKYENYITASLGMKIGNYGARGGIFFGRTCTIDPIKLWDPFAAEALGDPNPTFTGAYVYGEMHIPVSEAILGVPASCFFQITADAGMGIFYFLEGPTWGGRLALGVDGEVLCLLSIGGRIDMIGFKSGERFKLKGKGSVYAEIGWCDFCAKVSKSVTMETEVGADGGMKGGQKTK